MSSVPAAASNVFFSVDTTTTMNLLGASTSGVVTLKAVSDIKLDYGYKVIKAPVTGSNIAYYGGGNFDGKADITSLGSSDNTIFISGVAAVSGILPTIGITWQAQDTNGGMSGRIWTISGKVEKLQMVGNTDKEVEYKYSLVMTYPPQVS
jgi:hypothetical protein